MRNKKRTVFINPGSVGQPRNHDSRAQYAVLDTERGVTLCTVQYASGNFRINEALLSSARTGAKNKIFAPGVFGEIGGYPIIIDGCTAYIDESVFPLEEMRAKNRESIALDGVENIADGCLIYTDALIEKAQKAFNVTLPKKVAFADIDATAKFIIEKIIKPSLNK